MKAIKNYIREVMLELVSILIPVYNREDLISETIQSALGQTYSNIEIIVVDNSSTDKTWDIIKTFSDKDPRVKVFKNDTNIGPVNNWMRCIHEANGKYGKVLWSDDLIHPDFISKTLPSLNNNDVGFVFTKTEIFSENKISECYNIGVGGHYPMEQYVDGVIFEGGYPVSPGCALFRLEDLRKSLIVDIPNRIGSDFSQHAIGNDLLIFLLVSLKYTEFVYIDQTLSRFRSHAGSISVSSSDGKLPLHYTLATAYFVENYRTDLIKKLNTKIIVLIVMYNAKKYSLHKIRNYYVSNTKFNVDIFFLVKKAFKRLIRYVV
jgi:glycosyltransferase involved in cell wall biosynthesis